MYVCIITYTQPQAAISNQLSARTLHTPIHAQQTMAIGAAFIIIAGKRTHNEIQKKQQQQQKQNQTHKKIKERSGEQTPTGWCQCTWRSRNFYEFAKFITFVMLFAFFFCFVNYFLCAALTCAHARALCSLTLYQQSRL